MIGFWNSHFSSEMVFKDGNGHFSFEAGRNFITNFPGRTEYPLDNYRPIDTVNYLC